MRLSTVKLVCAAMLSLRAERNHAKHQHNHKTHIIIIIIIIIMAA
jgi:hypothetical protein